MRIAVLSDQKHLAGRVPDTYETAPFVLFIETEDGSLRNGKKCTSPEALVRAVVESGCEAVVCGPHIGQACFDPIADAGITRYNGAGLGILTAADAAERSALPLIPDYEGGHGCGSGSGNCEDGHCAE
jgi:predicted Fe-Mo cluster-binding NifX family protein